MSTPKALERPLDPSPDGLRPAVERPRSVARLRGLEVEAELGRDHDLVAYRSERFPDELLVRERAVHLRRVEEGDAAVDRGADERDHHPHVAGGAVAPAHRHAAEPDRRDLEVAASECSRLHGHQGFTRTLIASRSFIAR